MTRITIREVGAEEGVHSATVSFDGEGEYPARVADPFSPEEEARLEWYFEEHLRFPFTGQVDARRAAESISTYGEKLFAQVFDAREAYARYREALQAGGAHTLRFEIVGSPEFHRLHWESLRDPSLPRPLALDASVLRRNLVPPTVRANPEPSPTINLLVVTARPHGERDVGYRTISRPLVEGLRQARLPVRVDVLRPGTYRALSKHLESVRGPGSAGYYHVVHFDVHGAAPHPRGAAGAGRVGRGRPLRLPGARRKAGPGAVRRQAGLSLPGGRPRRAGGPGGSGRAERAAALAPGSHRGAERLRVRQAGGLGGDQPGEPAHAGRDADGAGDGVLGDGERRGIDDARAVQPPVRGPGPPHRDPAGAA